MAGNDYLRGMVVWIIIVTVGISLLAFRNQKLMDDLLLWPFRMQQVNQFYRFLTSGFVHADMTHLIFNMVTFYFFGILLQGQIGTVYFLMLYLIGIVVAGIPSYIKKQNNPGYRSLGASGGVSAIVFAAIYLNPWSKLYLFFAIGMPSIVFAVLYLVYSGYSAKKGIGIINHDAHLWGALFGIVFMLIIDPTHGRYFISQLMQPHW